MSESGASSRSVGQRAVHSAAKHHQNVMQELVSENADGSQTDFTSQYAPGPDSARDRQEHEQRQHIRERADTGLSSAKSGVSAAAASSSASSGASPSSAGKSPSGFSSSA